MLSKTGSAEDGKGKLHSSSLCCAAAEILRRVRETECAVFCSRALGNPRASPRLGLESNSEEFYTGGVATETSQEQGNWNCKCLSFPAQPPTLTSLSLFPCFPLSPLPYPHPHYRVKPCPLPSSLGTTTFWPQPECMSIMQSDHAPWHLKSLTAVS